MAFAIAKTMLNGLHRQIYLFGEITQSGQQPFEWPQKLATFALAHPRDNAAFIKDAFNYLTRLFGTNIRKTSERHQKNITHGLAEDVYPYPDHLSFCDLRDQQ